MDTCILCRLSEPGSTLRSVTEQCIKHLIRAGGQPFIALQNLVELWVVATRPKSGNGWGWDTAQVSAEVRKIEDTFPVLDEVPHLLKSWKKLVTEYKVMGKKAHDTRLVALMKAHGIGAVVTFDVDDFRRFKGIKVIDPKDASSWQRGKG